MKRNPVVLLTGLVPIILMVLATMFGAQIPSDTAAQITLGIGAVATVAGSVYAAAQVRERDRSTVVILGGLIPAGVAVFNLLTTWLHPGASPLEPETAVQLQAILQAVFAAFTRDRVTPLAHVADPDPLLTDPFLPDGPGEPL